MTNPPRVLSHQILVAGGGSAGTAAAIAAARRGHDVLLIEEGNALGGVSTSGGVSEWYANLEGLGDILATVVAEVDRFGAKHDRFYNGEYLKIAWLLLAQQAGVKILFHTTLNWADPVQGEVARVRLLALGHTIDVYANWYIDATGEGDLAASAGAQYMQGHPDTGQTLHMTLAAMLFDTGKPVPQYLPADLQPINTPDELPGFQGAYNMADGRLYCNMTKVMAHDPTDPFSLSDAECEARRQITRIVHYLQRTKYPTYMLASTGARIGIREGRRIVGDYVLTEADILGDEPRVFADGVAVATSQIDFHSLTRPGHAGWRQRVQPYNIPFRCLIAKGFKNLLMAGKCISGDQVAHSSYRMTPTCCAMGQAAGTATALAIENGAKDIRRVNINKLRAQLSADGMELNPRKHRSFAPEVTPNRNDAA